MRGQAIEDRIDENANGVKDRARQSPLLRFFILPPVEKRRMPFGFISKSFRPPLTKDDDDTYIYYLLTERSLILTILFSALLWVSYISRTTFNFYFFSIDVRPDNLAGSAGWAYSHIVSSALFLIFLPYAWLLIRANIDFSEFDLLRRNSRLTENQKKGWRILCRMYLTVALIAFVAYGSSVSVNYVISEYDSGIGKLGHLSSLRISYNFFLFTLAFLAWLYSYIPSMAAMACAIGYQHLRRLGPQSGQSASSRERITKGDSHCTGDFSFHE